MFTAILVLLALPFTNLSVLRGIEFKPLSKVVLFIFIGNFLILMLLGAKHVEFPYIEFGQISTFLYFANFLILVPLFSLFETSLNELENNDNSSNINSIYKSADVYDLNKSNVNIALAVNGKYNISIISSVLMLITLFSSKSSFFYIEYCDAPRA